jgi:hypothetical protein
MVVENVAVAILRGGNEFRYKCVDLVKEDQGWLAYENDNFMFTRSYNWRIATDDDIAKYLSRFVDIPLGKVGEYYLAKLTDDGIILTNEFVDSIHLDANELADLKRIIDERVE